MACHANSTHSLWCSIPYTVRIKSPSLEDLLDKQPHRIASNLQSQSTPDTHGTGKAAGQVPKGLCPFRQTYYQR